MTGKLIFYANFIFQFPSTRIGVGFDPSCKYQIACVRHHSVNGTDAGWVRFVMTEHDLAHFHKCEFIYFQSSQRFFNLIESGDQCAEESAGLERRADLWNVVVWKLHIEEERICISFVETLSDVTQLEVHARSEPDPFQIFSSEFCVSCFCS